MAQYSFHSPLDDLTLTEEDGKIVSLDWGWSPLSRETPLLRAARQQLDAYFDGLNPTFDLPLLPRGTAFQHRVWAAMAEIPYGETRTYGDIAAQIRSHPRAVGGACGRNPLPILIPCHRVMGQDGRLTGYSGGDGVRTKRFLLALEQIAPR